MGPLDSSLHSTGNIVSYMCQDEERYRRSVWEEEKKKVEKHNAEYEQGKTSFFMGLNEFSDMVTEIWIVNSVFLFCMPFQYLLVFNVLFAFP